MCQRILAIFKSINKPLTIKEIISHLEIESKVEYEQILRDLATLQREKVIKINRQGSYYLINNAPNLTGILQLNPKGFGFIKTAEKQEYFVKAKNLNQALDTDEVLFTIINSNLEEELHLEAKVIKIIKRGITSLVGVILWDEKLRTKYFKINNLKWQHLKTVISNPTQAIVNTIVVCKIQEVSDLQVVTVFITAVIGNINDPGADILAIAYEFKIKTKFNQDTLEQAQNINLQESLQSQPQRKDMTSYLFVTIDGNDAKDLDDAICVLKLKNGNYRLIVAIADVAHYVFENSPLDLEALERGTSVYLTDRVIPMLPAQLSNDICSLNANVPRLVMICDMEINLSGKTISHTIYEGIINVKRRMSYEEVNLAFKNKHPAFIKENPKIYEMLIDSLELHKILRNYKEKAGVIDFDLKEAKLIVDGTGKIKDIEVRVRDIAEMLIEDFMIRANETVASTIYWMNLPFIYRIHNKPKIQKLKEVYTILKTMGFNIKGKMENIRSKDLQVVLEKIKKEPWFQVVATLFLRSMEKARYDISNVGHFGLASECYTHFTSPIRRYPDLVVHRMLKKYLIENQISRDIVNRYGAILELQAEKSSVCEIKALECERAVEQMKKAEFMEQHIGDIFKGIVSAVTSFGMFIELENTIEGLVHISEMKDDYYIYDEKSLRLVGRNKRQEYFLGKTVTIKVKSASKHERKIDFTLINENRKINTNNNGGKKKWR